MTTDRTGKPYLLTLLFNVCHSRRHESISETEQHSHDAHSIAPSSDDKLLTKTKTTAVSTKHTRTSPNAQSSSLVNIRIVRDQRVESIRITVASNDQCRWTRIGTRHRPVNHGRRSRAFKHSLANAIAVLWNTNHLRFAGGIGR